MNIQLVGGPDDGISVEVPVPLPQKLTIIVVRSDEEREYLEALNTVFGRVPDEIPATYFRDEYLLAARRSEPVYLFRSETPHGGMER